MRGGVLSPEFGTTVPLSQALLTEESVDGRREHAECLDFKGLEADF